MKQSCNSSKFRAASHFLHISAEYVTIKISVASSFFLTLTGQSLHVLTASNLENIPSAFAKHVSFKPSSAGSNHLLNQLKNNN